MPNYYGNNQFYVQDLQNMRDRIDRQLNQLQHQNQMQQIPQPITQNFQLAPQQTNNELESKFVNSLDDVKNTFVMKTGLFTNKDFSTLWVKDVTGNIRTFRTEEVVELDEKDKEIAELKQQINEMKGMIANATKCDNSNFDEPIEVKKSSRISNNKQSNAK